MRGVKAGGSRVGTGGARNKACVGPQVLSRAADLLRFGPEGGRHCVCRRAQPAARRARRDLHTGRRIQPCKAPPAAVLPLSARACARPAAECTPVAAVSEPPLALAVSRKVEAQRREPLLCERARQPHEQLGIAAAHVAVREDRARDGRPRCCCCGGGRGAARRAAGGTGAGGRARGRGGGRVEPAGQRRGPGRRVVQR